MVYRECQLLDDGSLDTVVLLPNGEEARFSQEYAAEWRCPKTGELDFRAFVDQAIGLEESYNGDA